MAKSRRAKRPEPEQPPIEVSPTPEPVRSGLPTYGFDETWTANLQRLAAAAGAEPGEYLLRLVKRAWIALPTGMR